MRIIDRLTKYLEYKKITAYSFERNCKVANGYLSKQRKGKGTIGSDILERIYQNYSDLNLTWLLAGEEDMLLKIPRGQSYFSEPLHGYAKEETVRQLNDKINLLQQALRDKDKIISLLEEREQSQGNDSLIEDFDELSDDLFDVDVFQFQQGLTGQNPEQEQKKEGLPGNPSYENDDILQ